jgi:hypothetical protein
VEVIEKLAFQSCVLLESCEFEQPSRLASIEDRAFTQCTSLTSFGFPGTIQFVGADCFSKSELGCLVFESVESIQRVVGTRSLEQFLTNIGIVCLLGVFEIFVKDGHSNQEFPGWIAEDDGNGGVSYVPECQRL